MRGDVITKVEDYDARDIRHADAQMLFKNAGTEIRLVVHRDNKLAVTKNITSNGMEPLQCSTALPPYSLNINLLSPNIDAPHRSLSTSEGVSLPEFLILDCFRRGASPLPRYGAYESALERPVDSLPHTVFPHLNDSGGYILPPRPESRSSRFSPMPTRDYQQDALEEAAGIAIQVIELLAPLISASLAR